MLWCINVRYVEMVLKRLCSSVILCILDYADLLSFESVQTCEADNALQLAVITSDLP